MQGTKQCPQCGTQLPPDAPEGNCPTCLVRLGLTVDVGETPPAEMTEGVHSANEPPLEGGDLASAPSQDLVDETKHIGQYVVLNKLGQGGAGEVWLGYDSGLERHVAIKVLKAQLQTETDQAAGFMQEARTAAALSHPNVITVYQVGQHAGRFFIAMEYLPRGSLQDELNERGRLDYREATLIIRDAVCGLWAAHEAGIVHRDVKPGNLLRAENGMTKVADFGMARLAVSGGTPTHSGKIYGTPSYIAPEQVRSGALDARTDLYSLTCTYYALLTGHSPFARPGEKVTPDVLLHRHVHDPFPAVQEEVPDLPGGIVAILCRGSQKDPAERYPSAQALYQDLQGVLSNLDKTAARAEGWSQGVAAPEAASAADGRLATAISRVSAGWKTPIVLIPAVAMLILTVALMAWVSRSPRLREPVLLGRTGLSKPTWVDTTIEWAHAGEAELAAARRDRANMLSGLASFTWEQIGRSLAPRDTATMGNQDPRELRLPDRFILDGVMGAVRVLEGKTWIVLAASVNGPSASLSSPGTRGVYPASRPGTMQRLPSFIGLVVFDQPAVAEQMVDYRPGDRVNLVVSKKDWGHFNADDVSQRRSPPQILPGAGQPTLASGPTLRDLAPCFRRFKDGDNALCFAGEAIEKPDEPLTWIEPSRGRVPKVTNARQLLASPGMMYRDMAAWAGKEGVLQAIFLSTEATGDGLVVSALITNSIERTIRLQLDLGKAARPEELLDYAPGDSVLAEVLLRGGWNGMNLLPQQRGFSPRGPSGSRPYQGGNLASAEAEQYAYGLSTLAGAVSFSRLPLAVPGDPRGSLDPDTNSAPGATKPGSPRRRDDTSARALTNLAANPLVAWTGISATCKRLQKVGEPLSLVAARGPRRTVALVGELTPRLANANPSVHQGQEVRWRGRLTSIISFDGETHLALTTFEPRFGATSFEAYTRQKGFMDEIADYLSSRESGRHGDDVWVRGSLVPVSGASFRLTESTLLLELKHIEREGHPASCVVVGRHRARDTIETNRVPSDFLKLLRDLPPAGTELTLSASFRYCYGGGRVGIGPAARRDSASPAENAATMYVYFPNVPESAWEDYNSIRGPVEVVGITRRPATTTEVPMLELEGKSIMRPGNPASLITERGRVAPLKDFSSDKRRWERLRYQSKLDSPERFQMPALYQESSKGDPLKITFHRLFYGYETLEVTCPHPPSEAEAFLRDLQPEDEVLLEVVLTSSSSFSPKADLVWLARAGALSKKLIFRSSE